MNKSLKVFTLWVYYSFLFGFVLIGELVWIAGSILTGEFNVQVDTNFFFGAIFAVVSFIPALIASSGIINDKNRRIARLIFYISLVLISICSIFWGAMQYEEILTYGDKIVKAYPLSIFIYYIFTISLCLYVMRDLYKKMGKQDNSEAELEFVLFALFLVITVAVAIFDIYKLIN